MAVAPSGTVTLLFTDLVGSTELRQKLGDDEAERLRRIHFRLLREGLAARGGQEVKNLGDGLMVAFASAVDAVACAVAMQQGVHRHNEQQGEGHRLHVRVGVHVGEPIREEEDYFGTPVDIAKRLCDSAQGGQILASDLVRGLVGSRGGHTFRELGSLALKGIAEPLSTCEVVWEPAVDETAADQPAAGRPAPPLPLPPLLASGERTAFVARKRELEQLQGCWERARSGQRQLFLVAGEPGVGKTRLAAEFALTAHWEGATVLLGHSDEEALMPYQPFVEALRHYINLCPLDELRAQAGASRAEVARLVPELARRLRDLPEPTLAEPDNERYRLFEAVSSLLTSASQDSPVLLVLDDLHWADKPTLLLLKYIMRSPEQSRLFILGTYRDTELARTHPLAETLADLRRDRLFERVTLKGLDERDVGTLIGALVGQESHSSLARAVHHQTEGNPFFIEEVLRNLTEAGGVNQTADRRTVDQLIDQMGIPEGVKEVIGQRLSRLSEECNRVLTIASVIGREFDLEALERIGGLSGDRPLEVVEEAMAASIVNELPGAVGSYSFSHALIRETLYDELASIRRARLHWQIGEVLEDLYGANLEPHLAALAHHFLEGGQGGDVRKAIDYAWRAGERATALLAYEEAAGHYERALEALDLQEPADESQVCEILLALGAAWNRAGERDKAIATLQRAANIARKLKDPERLARAALGFRGTAVVDELRVGLLDEALGALPEQDSALRARLLGDLARALYFSDPQQRRASLSKQAVEMAQRIRDPATLAYALHARHFALAGPENVEDRLASVTEIVRLAEEVGDKDLALTAHTWRIVDLLELGNIQDVDSEIERCSQLAAEFRQPFHLWRMTRLQAMRSFLGGQFEEGERLAQAALGIGRQIQEPYAVQDFGVQIGTLRREQGRSEEIEPSVKTFVEQYPEFPAWRCALALLYSELGREEEARREFERLAVKDFSDLPQDVLWLVGLTLLCEECALLGDARRAARLYELLLPYAKRCVVIGDAVACYGSASRYLGLLATTMSRWEVAEQHLEDALQMNVKLEARPYVAHTQHEYAEMLVARSGSGHREKALALLDTAIDTFQELGMRASLQRAEKLLSTLS